MNRLGDHLNENNLMISFQSAYTKFNSTETTLLALHDHILSSIISSKHDHSSHQSDSHSCRSPPEISIRTSHCPWLLQGLWHSPSFHFNEKIQRFSPYRITSITGLQIFSLTVITVPNLMVLFQAVLGLMPALSKEPLRVPAPLTWMHRTCIPVTQRIILNKYADDCYLIVPSVNSHLVQEELDHVAEWANVNNLKLNSTKSKEMIIRRPKTKLSDLPHPITHIERVDSMNILGVTLRFDLTFHEHVDGLVRKSAQTMYALRLLRSQGLHGRFLWDVILEQF